MAGRVEYLTERAAELNFSFGKAITTIQGWLGTGLVVYLAPGTVWQAFLVMWALDLSTGTILALKVTRILKQDRDMIDYPEIAEAIVAGKATPFNWQRWRLSLEKLATNFLLLIGCEVFKLWLAVDRPWSLPGIALVFSVIYFVVLFTDFRSIVRNTALITRNSALLWLWRILGKKLDQGLEGFENLQEKAAAIVLSSGKKNEAKPDFEMDLSVKVHNPKPALILPTDPEPESQNRGVIE